MNLAVAADPVPIELDADGVARVGGTRISLSSVVWSYKLGGAAEVVHEDFPDLSLADIHAAIACYLRHQGGAPAPLGPATRPR